MKIGGNFIELLLDRFETLQKDLAVCRVLCAVELLKNSGP